MKTAELTDSTRVLELSASSMKAHVHDAQRAFQRVLVSWAGDMLELRRTGRLQPRWESTPRNHPPQAPSVIVPMNDAA